MPWSVATNSRSGLPRPLVLGRDLLMRTVAQELVTPFTGFVLSDAFLSSEVEKYGLEFLNPHSRNLAHCTDFREMKTIYVQVDELEVFETRILPRIDYPFTLVTGKWNLPGLKMSRAVERVLGNPLVSAWFSQNQIYADLPIFPFPYGINLSSAPLVLWMRSRRLFSLGRDRQGVFVPNAAIYTEGHSPREAHEERVVLEPLMRERMRFPKYLSEILAHKYVACPPGDRYDTYRHWETIALGAIPITTFPEKFRDLFEDAVLETVSIASAVGSVGNFPAVRPKPNLATVRYWKRRLAEVR